MRALVQRVEEAWVTSAPDPKSEPQEVGRISTGMVALIGVTHDDDVAKAHKLADKLAGLRIFASDDGVMNLGCTDVGAEVLVVSQFTLYGDTRKGRRPSYVAAARPEVAEPLITSLVDRLCDHGLRVETGRFRTHMRVGLINDGPVTVTVEV